MKKTKKTLLSLILLTALCLSLCACGSSPTYGVSTIVTLVPQEYSLGFRNDDPIYFYVTAALETLAAEGVVDQLTAKWFGQNIITIDKNAEALSRLTPPDPRVFIIGLNLRLRFSSSSAPVLNSAAGSVSPTFASSG